MSTNNPLMRVFWPIDISKTQSPGVLVGWRNSELDLFVVAALLGADARVVDNALRTEILLRNSPHPFQSILERCGGQSLEVLGTVNSVVQDFEQRHRNIVAYTDQSSAKPRMHVLHQPSLLVQVIIFARPEPSRMQYSSLYPISLALDDKNEGLGFNIGPFAGIDAVERKARHSKQELIAKLKLHTVKIYSTTKKEEALPIIIKQVNCSSEINDLLQKNINLVRGRSKRALSVSEQLVESAKDLWYYTKYFLRYAFTVWILPVLTNVFVIGLMVQRIAAEVFLRVADRRLRPQGVALKDISATAQQMDLRLQQFCYWPIQYMTLRQRKDNWQSITSSHPEYIRFYNSLWLVANDIIIGVAIGAYIIENADLVASIADTMLGTWSIDSLRKIISWLMVYPAGLKLNNELAKFLGDLFLWVIDYWGGCMMLLRPAFPYAFRLVGVASFAGATMPLSLLSDLLSLFTLHIHCFYIASARIYGWQLQILISLFHLFRGKKRNILRNRIDSCDYTLDQLLLGTILFTLLTFLLPTVIVFYLSFAFARMAIISIKAVLDTLLACLNHFPLFALMLRFKDSGRLPGGIRFDLQDGLDKDKAASSVHYSPNSVSYISMTSIPLPVAAIFHEYFQFGNRIRKHYLSLSVFLCLATGGFVPPLHRRNLYSLQYSMLPAQRVGIAELWARLQGTLAASPLMHGSPAPAGHHDAGRFRHANGMTALPRRHRSGGSS